jgi:hypothetical protein
MNSKKTILSAAIVAAIGILPVASQAATVTATSMSITSGEFGMGFFTNNSFIPITDFGSGAAQLIGTATGEGWDVNTLQLAPAPSAIGSFIFGNVSGGDPYINTFTAVSDSQGVDAGGHALPSASWDDVTGAGVSLVMESFYGNWNGANFNQGSNTFISFAVEPNCTVSCNYTAEWLSVVTGGPSSSQIGTWRIAGTISSVPVPAAAWLMGAGLLGLVGVARRGKG